MAPVVMGRGRPYPALRWAQTRTGSVEQHQAAAGQRKSQQEQDKQRSCLRKE